MIVLVATLFLLVSALQTSNCGEVCQTPACAETAERVTKWMNLDPCDDFFEFACRGWIAKNPIPPNQQTIGIFGLIRAEIEMKLHQILNTTDDAKDGKPIKLARAMYRTCMDEDTINKLGMKPFHDMMEKLGLPQGPPSDEEAKILDIPKIAALASRLYGMNIFLKVSVSQNSTDSTKNQLTIEQMSLIFSNLHIYLRHPELFHEIADAYRKYVNRLFELGGAGNKSEEYTTEHVDILTEISKIMGTPTERVSKNYHRSVMTIYGVQEITDPHGDTWNWTTFFNTLFQQTDIIVDTKNDAVFLNDALYFVNLASILKQTSPGKLGRLMYALLLLSYRDTVYGHTSNLSRRQICMSKVNAHFELALTAAYVEKHFNVQYKKKAMEMWSDVIASADEMITQLDWMDAETKAAAHKKFNATRPLIGYPEWITNQEDLNKVYEEINVIDGRLFETYAQYHLIMGKRTMNSWKQVPDKNNWKIPGTSVGAMYISELNAVEIAAGVLHPPIYGNEVESLNYGAIGTIMGIQLIHSLANPQRPTDENGNVRQWWSKETVALYQEKIRCLLKRYDKVVITRLGKNLKLNGGHIYDTSIADIGGLKIAFGAYKKFKARSEPQQALPTLDKYTDEQLLFLGFAQTYCNRETDDRLKTIIQTSPFAPNRYRIIEALQNSDEFAKAWNCSRGSPMNPGNTCKIY